MVELVGSLASPARAATQLPAPARRQDTALKSRDSADERSRGLAANNNEFSTPPRLEGRDRAEPRTGLRPERPPGRPSANLLTLLLAQGTDTASAAAKRFDAAIAAYQRAGARQPATAPMGIAFPTQTIDRNV